MPFPQISKWASVWTRAVQTGLGLFRAGPKKPIFIWAPFLLPRPSPVRASGFFGSGPKSPFPKNILNILFNLKKIIILSLIFKKILKFVFIFYYYKIYF